MPARQRCGAAAGLGAAGRGRARNVVGGAGGWELRRRRAAIQPLAERAMGRSPRSAAAVADVPCAQLPPAPPVSSLIDESDRQPARPAVPHAGRHRHRPAPDRDSPLRFAAGRAATQRWIPRSGRAAGPLAGAIRDQQEWCRSAARAAKPSHQCPRFGAADAAVRPSAATFAAPYLRWRRRPAVPPPATHPRRRARPPATPTYPGHARCVARTAARCPQTAPRTLVANNLADHRRTAGSSVPRPPSLPTNSGPGAAADIGYGRGH